MAIAAGQYVVEPFRRSLTLLLRYRQLVWEMTRREITDRYSGQILGAAWAVLHPLFLIALYVFVFTVVLGLKLPEEGRPTANYAIYLLAGLIPWMGFQEALMKSCFAVSSNAALVKQVVFPLEVLAIKCVASSLLNQLIATVFFLLYAFAFKQFFVATYLLLPLLIAVQALGMIGFAYMLSSICVFLRDIKDVVQLFCLTGLYLVPVFYLPSWLPTLLKPILALNPFSHMVWCYQDILFYGAIVHPMSFVVFGSFCLLGFVGGYHVFQGLKPMYGNFL